MYNVAFTEWHTSLLDEEKKTLAYSLMKKTTTTTLSYEVQSVNLRISVFLFFLDLLLTS